MKRNITKKLRILTLFLALVLTLTCIQWPARAEDVTTKPVIGEQENVAEKMIVINNGQLINEVPDAGFTVESNTKGTFENLSFGNSNSFWISAKIDATYSTNEADLRLTIGHFEDGSTVDVGLRPLNGYAAGWQAVVWNSPAAGVRGSVVSDTNLVKLTKSAPQGQTQDTTYKASFTYTLRYNNGEISLWIDDELVFDAKSDALNKLSTLTIHPGFHAYDAVAGTISNVQIWGDVESIDANEALVTIYNQANQGVVNQQIVRGLPINVSEQVTGLFENLSFGSTNSYFMTAKVQATYAKNNADLRLVIGQVEDGRTIDIGVRPINGFDSKWQVVVWNSQVPYDEGSVVNDLVFETANALNGQMAQDNTSYTAEFTYAVKYNDGKITLWIDNELVFADKALGLNNFVLQPGFHAYDIVSGQILDVKIGGDVREADVADTMVAFNEGALVQTMPISLNDYTTATFDNLDFAPTNDYWMSANVSATYKAGASNVALILGRLDGYNLEVSLRPLNSYDEDDATKFTSEKWQAVLWASMNVWGQTVVNSSAVNSNVPAPQGASIENGVFNAEFTYTVHYKNGFLSLWIDGAIVFNEVNIASGYNSALPELSTLKLQPGIHAFNIDNTCVSDIKIWGDVAEEDISEKIVVTNDGVDETSIYAEKEQISVAQNKIATFENAFVGASNDYWVSAKVNSTYSSGESSVHLILGKLGNYNLEVGLRPLNAYNQEPAKNFTSANWQAVLWGSTGGGVQGIVVNAGKAVNSSVPAPNGASAVDGVYKAEFTYTVHYENGLLSVWIDGTRIFDEVNIADGYSQNLPSLSTINLQPGVHAYQTTNATVSDIKIWGSGLNTLNGFATVMPNVGVPGQIQPEGQPFVYRDTKFNYNLYEWLEGTSYLSVPMEGFSAEVTEAGWVYMLVPESLKTFMINNGYTSISVIQKGKLSSQISERVAVVGKEVEVGDSVSYDGRWAVLLADTDGDYDVQAELDTALEKPEVLMYPTDSQYQDGNREWQGIPGIAKDEETGRLWATWYSGGSTECTLNWCTLYTSIDDGQTWTGPVTVVDAEYPIRCYDPNLWMDPDGRMWFIWQQSYEYFDGRCGVWAMYTENPGDAIPTWSEPQRIANGIAMNDPIVTKEGNWILPTAIWNSSSFVPSAELANEAYNNAYISTDKGASWSLLGSVKKTSNQRDCDENMIIEQPDGTLRMLIRTYAGIEESYSEDGKTWTDATNASITKVISRFYITNLDAETQLLVYNDPENKSTTRSHLTAALSTDAGQTWSEKLVIDERVGTSYPDVHVDDSGNIYIIYDRDRYGEKEILMAKITKEDIQNGQIGGTSFVKKLINKDTAVEYGVLTVGDGNLTGQVKLGVPVGGELPTGYIRDGETLLYISDWSSNNYTKDKECIPTFIDTKMLAVGTQYGKSATEGYTDYRFVGSVNGVEGYQKVGFVFSKKNENPEIDGSCLNKEKTTVYVKLNDDGTPKSASAIYGSEYSQYLFAHEFSIQHGTKLYARAYVILDDGTIVYGKATPIQAAAIAE